jgi:sec1 family domain-containing protein 1
VRNHVLTDITDAELTKYKEEAEAITKKTGVTDFEDLENDTSASAQHLKTAITLLPELRERKATLDMHMNILAAILGEIQNRQLDNYYQLGEDVTKQTKAQMLELIKAPNKGQPTDKLRLFIIWYLSAEQDVSRSEWTQFEEALVAEGCDGTCLAYIRQLVWPFPHFFLSRGR